MNKPRTIVTPNTITVVFDDGIPASVRADEDGMTYDRMYKAIRDEEWDRVRELAFPSVGIVRALNEAFEDTDVTVEDDCIYHKGEPLHNVVTERILALLEDGFDISPMVLFLNRLMKNPSNTAVNELFGFLEVSKLPITDEGKFIAYKRINRNWKDEFSGTIDNSIGAVVEVPRNTVDDNRNNCCSTGLHFCAYEYLSAYGSNNGGRVIVVEIDPADVVSIPVDYSNRKGRCCKYTVVRELELESTSHYAEPTERLEGDFVPNGHGNQVTDDAQVLQIIPLTGEVKAMFGSAGEASRATGVDSSSISKVLRGKRNTAGGYGWKWSSDEDEEDEAEWVVNVSFRQKDEDEFEAARDYYSDARDEDDFDDDDTPRYW